MKGQYQMQMNLGSGPGFILGPKLADLRKMTDEELVEKHDWAVVQTPIPANFFLSELHRREENRRTKSILYCTYAIAVMTVVVTVSTILSLWRG